MLAGYLKTVPVGATVLQVLSRDDRAVSQDADTSHVPNISTIPNRSFLCRLSGAEDWLWFPAARFARNAYLFRFAQHSFRSAERHSQTLEP
ncbi:hypothetical protein Sm713_71440 [Streptomyces sp. TS71-3]|nr:hypothetical protein Sm713_71440 [Streptomyces sp. TS71-3]